MKLSWKTFMKSNKTIEEAIAFFESDMDSDDEKETEEARSEFDKLMASARRTGDGSIEVRIPVLSRGE
jgi:hypothetical protein